MQNVSLIMPLCFQNRRQSFHLLMLLTGINGKYEDDFIQALILNLSLNPLNCFINIRKKIDYINLAYIVAEFVRLRGSEIRHCRHRTNRMLSARACSWNW